MGVTGSELLGLGERGGVEVSPPAFASVSRNSTHKREKDYKIQRVSKSLLSKRYILRTSVSSVFSKSALLLEATFDGRPQNEGVELGGARCNPAFSRSASVHDRTDEISWSISKRFGSARGVARKERRTFVTRRRSTLVSDEFRRRRRRASIRCSFMITAVVTDSIFVIRGWNGQKHTFMS